MAKNEQKLSITFRLNFSYPKLFRFIYPSYHPKIIEDILQNVPRQVCLFQNDYLIDYDDNEIKMKNVSIDLHE